MVSSNARSSVQNACARWESSACSVRIHSPASTPEGCAACLGALALSRGCRRTRCREAAGGVLAGGVAADGVVTGGAVADGVVPGRVSLVASTVGDGEAGAGSVWSAAAAVPAGLSRTPTVTRPRTSTTAAPSPTAASTPYAGWRNPKRRPRFGPGSEAEPRRSAAGICDFPVGWTGRVNHLQRALLRRHVRRQRRDVRDGLAGGRTRPGTAPSPQPKLGDVAPSVDEALARSGAAAELVGAGVGGVRRDRGLTAVGVGRVRRVSLGRRGLRRLGLVEEGIGLGGGGWGWWVGRGLGWTALVGVGSGGRGSVGGGRLWLGAWWSGAGVLAGSCWSPAGVVAVVWWVWVSGEGEVDGDGGCESQEVVSVGGGEEVGREDGGVAA